MIGLFGDLSSIWIGLISGVIGLVFVGYLVGKILKKDPGSEVMIKISKSIQDGAMAFLAREYKSIAIFVVILAAIIFFGVAKKTAFAFISGAVCSVLAGYIGMKIATSSNSRTAQASVKSVGDAIDVAFPGGSVMGMSVVSLGLLGLSGVYLIFIWCALCHQPSLFDAILEATQLIAGFSMGASSVALFARVGGGIYTKAADVGADALGQKRDDFGRHRKAELGCLVLEDGEAGFNVRRLHVGGLAPFETRDQAVFEPGNLARGPVAAQDDLLP